MPGVSAVAQSYAAALDDGSRRLASDTTDALQRGNLVPQDREACPTRPQAFLQWLYDQSRWRQLKAKLPQQTVLLDAVRRPHAGALWACFPSQALHLKLSPQEFRIDAKMWLGIAVYSDGGDGTRALLESSAGRITRHDAIRDVVFETAKSAACRPWKERRVDSSSHRPADCYLPNWSLGRPLCVDVTISHPSQANATTPAEGEETSASARASLQAAADKVRKHGTRCANAGVDFLPLVVCAYGGWLPEGEKFLTAIGRQLSDHSGLPIGVVMSQLWQRLSITLWRTNARIILHRAPKVDLESWDLPAFARPSSVS